MKDEKKKPTVEVEVEAIEGLNQEAVQQIFEEIVGPIAEEHGFKLLPHLPAPPQPQPSPPDQPQEP